MDIEIKELSVSHKLCVVTIRKGYAYACTWAIEKDNKDEIVSPTIQQVKEAWKEERTSFQKFNGNRFV